MNAIESFSGEYRWLSNFARADIELDQLVYPSVENAYQAAKFLDHSVRLGFTSITAHEAKVRGRDRDTGEIRPNWDSIKLRVMEYLLLQKFTHYTEHGKKLIATGNCNIVEGNTWNDTYWGVCKGRGHNHLGNLIMKIRSQLQRELGLKVESASSAELKKAWDA
jgi:ribA/ribD-fused uncharacterized protein